MKKNLLRAGIGLGGVCVAVLLSQVGQPAPPKLSEFVPAGPVLYLEAKDFAALLSNWRASQVREHWLSSADYSAFSQSHLFMRLDEVYKDYAGGAGFAPDASMLQSIAGSESALALYDIGKLEFLYITRMPAAQADRTQLFQARGSFQRRHAGNADFYIRTSGADYSTVAFALVPAPSGDLVVLATREDLIANALKLIAAASPANSIRQEPWFRDASAALPAEKPAPVLHMVLNLDRIAVDPHFRSYWIQRNITWTHQFRAAASDLYVEPARFREERVLLPKSPESQPSTSLNIASLAALVPSSTGVFRVISTQDPSIAVTAIQEKLLGSYTAPPTGREYAPDPSLQAPQSGSASDLETRIDTLPPASPSASTDGLTHIFQTANIDAVLTLSSAQSPPETDGLWVPIRSAVVLHAANPWNAQTMALALQQTLRGSLTAATIGIDFQPTDNAVSTIYTLAGPRPVFFAISSTPAQGNLVLLADDQPLLLELLHNLVTNPPEKVSTPATSIAVFNHSSQRAPYIRLTSLIDGTNNQARDSRNAAATGLSGNAGMTSAPAFFSRNIRSLSDTFAILQSERIVERTVGSNLRQTVTYVWQTP